MDYQKKKLLTQSVAYMQAHLTITTEFITSLRNGSVLTDEELSTIQKDDTTSGKVLELLCLLKRKDNRTFTRFIQVLEERKCNDVVKLLKNKGVSDSQTGDSRTAHYLENFLGKTSLNQRTMNDMAHNLILREIHHDEITQLQEKIAALQRQIKAKNNLHCDSSQSIDTGSDRSTPSSRSTPTDPGQSPGPSTTPSAGTPQWDVPGQFQEMDTMMKQKDDIIRRREEEYMKLRTILTATQTDMQSVLDLNNQYLSIIGQMNQMQMSSAATPRVLDKQTAMLELERKLEETEHQMELLEGEMDEITSELKMREAELDKAQRREKKYKDMLGLPVEANVADIENKIKQIIDEGSMRKQEVDRIQRELNKLMGNRSGLEERLTSLNREKDKVEFHLRQQQLTIKKMNRMKIASSVVQSAEDTLAANGYDRSQSLKLPYIDRSGSQLGLSSSKSTRPTSQQYCMFCRTEYQPLKAQTCRLHFRPIRNGKWTCCNDDSHRGAGCMQVPHFYIEITVDKKVFLTDGARYMELT